MVTAIIAAAVITPPAPPPAALASTPGDEALLWLAALVIPAGLGGLLLLMEWLENRFILRMAGDEIRRALQSSLTPEELEQAIARSAAAFFPTHRPP